MKIGIGVTTYNRPAQVEQTVSQIRKFSPKSAKIVVVDDGSVTPANINGVEVFRFASNQGAPIAKNKCLELLEDCEHIFLFDDDTYPIAPNWWRPYVDSPEPHLNYTFRQQIGEFNGHPVFESPNGCLMYFHRSVLEILGGFDPEYTKYGYWHGSMSCRIYNAGMTSFPFMDAPGSRDLIHSMDEHKQITTATPEQGRYLPANRARYLRDIEASHYIPYKAQPKVWYSNPYSTAKNIGRALNEFCEQVPDGDWICLQDGDMLYLTPDWGQQIEAVIKTHGQHFDLIGCVTNKLGRDIQRHGGEFCTNEDMRYHYDLAVSLRDSQFGVVEDVTKKRYIAGMFMLFPKSVWQRHKFKENSAAFDDFFSLSIVKAGGRLGLMRGLYVYHLYRIWADKPQQSKEHLH